MSRFKEWHRLAAQAAVPSMTTWMLELDPLLLRATDLFLIGSQCHLMLRRSSGFLNTSVNSNAVKDVSLAFLLHQHEYERWYREKLHTLSCSPKFRLSPLHFISQEKIS